ncbi:MAG: glutamine--tRNA ligase/YqeY domain fusion protein [Spirochaetales bacterium]|nr:glutamine--tRNA ligase/YqeY domain fusion protein [Spirochaetales bacterium]
METPNFIHDFINKDCQSGRFQGKVVTRFPPEPNGYLHIGHAKSITLNFGTAAKYGGKCNLRFDDTNPAKEEDEYVQSILEDVRWLVEHDNFEVLYASDYFQVMYDHAVELIKLGKAYVDSCSSEEISQMRGAPTAPGLESPWRQRSVAENLELFQAMTEGKFEEGACVLRAKIDMSSPNINLRDPILYRIKKSSHHRTGEKWVVYPMYDWAHGWEDSVEGITHSLCTLEFENHRPLYDWFLDQFPQAHHPQQIEFNKLAITYTMLSKRNLLELVKTGYVDGWSDPRMPTLSGLRRRGYTPSSLRKFAEATGFSKTDGRVDLAMLEFFIREELNKKALRVMAVFDPIKVVLIDYPTAKTEFASVENNPEDQAAGIRQVPFSGELWIDGEDFSETPAKGWFRLAPGTEVRLKGGYFITCREVVKNPDGSIRELRCSYDPQSWGGESPDGRKVKGTIQWVSARHAVEIEARMYDKLFTIENLAAIPEDKHWKDYLNPESLVVKSGYAEPELSQATAGQTYQFLRKAYFVPDSKDFSSNRLVFNRTVTLKDNWNRQKELP